MTAEAAAALLHRAAQARQSGDTQEAVSLCLDLLRQDSQNSEACRLLGEIALHGGLYAQATQMLGIAAGLSPRDAALQVNLGAAHHAMDNWDEAEACYRRALNLDPSLIQARANLAAVLADKGDTATAEREYRAVLELQPLFADTHVNLGNLLRNRGDLPAAIESYRKAVVCNPSHPMAHNSLGGALLLSEAWAEGWSELEWRWQLGDNPALRARHKLPLWEGDDLRGRHILVWGEQGIGDVVLFATMLPDLLAMGARVTLELDARLVELFQRSFPEIGVIAWSSVPSPGRFDCHTNIGRLGLFLRATAESFANSKAYLRPDPDRVAAFRERYRLLGPGPLIGIAWQSKSPTHRRKSLTLDDLTPLLRAHPEAIYVSLQYGDVRDEIAGVSRRLGVRIHHDDSFDNWADLDGVVAQIAALDRVVTVSNINAHLAGAAGVPAHVLVTQNALWYWPHAKSVSPWYRTVRLTRLSDYRSVHAALKSVAEQLRSTAGAAASE
jgi:Flp pilus assembly protein TadD